MTELKRIELKIKSKIIAKEMMGDMINKIEDMGLNWDIERFNSIYYMMEIVGEQKELIDFVWENDYDNWDKLKNDMREKMDNMIHKDIQDNIKWNLSVMNRINKQLIKDLDEVCRLLPNITNFMGSNEREIICSLKEKIYDAKNILK